MALSNRTVATVIVFIVGMVVGAALTGFEEKERVIVKVSPSPSPFASPSPSPSPVVPSACEDAFTTVEWLLDDSGKVIQIAARTFGASFFELQRLYEKVSVIADRQDELIAAYQNYKEGCLRGEAS